MSTTDTTPHSVLRNAGAALFAGGSAAAQYALFTQRPGLMTRISPVARSALVVMPALFAFALRAQHEINHCAQQHHEWQ